MKNQTTNKSFILHKDSLSILDQLTDEQAGKLFKAIYHYQKTGEIGIVDQLVKIAITPFLNQFARDTQKYDSIVERNKENIAKRWNTKNTTGKSGIPNLTKNTYSDSKSDSKKDNKNKKDFTPPTLQEIQNYCIERNNQVDPAKFFDYYNAGNWSDAKGSKIKNWKQKLIIWENKTTGGGSVSQPDAKNLCELINKMAGASYLTAITIVNNKAMLHFKSLEDREKLRNLENIQEIKNKISSELGTDGIESEIRK